MDRVGTVAPKLVSEELDSETGGLCKKNAVRRTQKGPARRACGKIYHCHTRCAKGIPGGRMTWTDTEARNYSLPLRDFPEYKGTSGRRPLSGDPHQESG